MTKMVHCLSFDIEEHFQVSAFASPMRRRHWDQFESRVERNTEKVLELLAMHNARATFFVLGWVAERHQRMVRQIVQAGHEVASHGYAHELVSVQTEWQFREDVRRARVLLEDITGSRVLGYRAPSFTIGKDTLWALRILVEEGYVYDSSIFPICHDRYGMLAASPFTHQLSTEAGPIWEIPPSTIKIAGVRVPVAGGGYLRLFPEWLFRRWLNELEAQNHTLVLYLHPWELDPAQPRMKGPLLSRFRHYVNLHKTEHRLIHLLEEFHFAPICEAIEPIKTIIKGLHFVSMSHATGS